MATHRINVTTNRAAHMYEIECKNLKAISFGERIESEPMYIKVEVVAMTRTSAGAAARKAGYDVRSVNMVG